MADLRRFMDGRTKTYDANLVLGAAGYNYATSLPGKDAHNASAAAATDGYVDLGDGYTQGFACFDLHTFAENTSTLTAGENAYVWLQGAKDTSFTTYVPLGILSLGDTSANVHFNAIDAGNFAAGDDQHDLTRYFVPFHNRYGDEIYRYVRMWIHVSPTLTTIAIEAFLTGLH